MRLISEARAGTLILAAASLERLRRGLYHLAVMEARARDR